MRTCDRPSIAVCVQVRPAAGRSTIGVVAAKESSREIPRHGSGPRCTVPARELADHDWRAIGNSMTAFRVFHGEFDPGSGRTLAACLTHASGATNQGLPWGKAANG